MDDDKINLHNIINFILYKNRKISLTLDELYSCLSFNFVEKEVLSILCDGLKKL